jgi:hypothetical protein
VSFTFFTAWHKSIGFKINNSFYFTSTFVFTPSTNIFAGLNAGILCAGIFIVVFFEILRPVFSALVLIIKLPKPLR